MRVKVFPADQGGCGMYRLTWPAQALQTAGHDIHITEGLPAIWRDDLATGTSELIGCAPVDADVVVLQRPLQRHLADIIPMLQDQGVAVVVEVDDDFTCIPPANAAAAYLHPRRSPDRNWHHLTRACAQADLVTVTTPALAKRYGQHGRVRVLPNCVPARYLTIPTPEWEGSVGWSGSVDTHPGDLEQTHGAVARIADTLGLEVRVVGTGSRVADKLGLRRPPVASGWVPIDRYPHQLAHLGIGIVPLASSAFNEAKSWLKGLECAAVGVPFVASPTGPYLQLHGHGAGDLAARPREWEAAIRRLATSADYRAERAAAGRAVARRWTVEENADRWLDAWTAARSRTRAAA